MENNAAFAVYPNLLMSQRNQVKLGSWLLLSVTVTIYYSNRFVSITLIYIQIASGESVTAGLMV